MSSSLFGCFSEGEVMEFLRRIEYKTASIPSPTYETLALVMAQFTLTVPFEQLDVAFGRRISVEPKKIFEKIVRKRRGGFCFENNVLLFEMLRSLGFAAGKHVGRVVLGGSAQGSTHLVIRVEIDSVFYLVDGGFGGSSLRRPLRLDFMGRPQLCYPDVYRLVPDGNEFVGEGGIRLQAFDANKWQETGDEVWLDQWASNLSDPVFDVDVDQKAFVFKLPSVDR